MTESQIENAIDFSDLSGDELELIEIMFQEAMNSRGFSNENEREVFRRFKEAITIEQIYRYEEQDSKSEGITILSIDGIPVANVSSTEPH